MQSERQRSQAPVLSVPGLWCVFISKLRWSQGQAGRRGGGDNQKEENPTDSKLGMVAHTCDGSTLDVEAGGPFCVCIYASSLTNVCMCVCTCARARAHVSQS